ncbi:MAG: S41 family peptidase [Gammaproteobacteria bacterium]
MMYRLRFRFRFKNLILISLLYILPFNINPIYAEPQKNKSNKLPIDDLQKFTTVLENIKNYYVNPIEDTILFNNAIRGMLAGLDPHSAYLDTDEFVDLKVSTTGKFGGIGIEVTTEDGFIRVITPIDDTPAKKAGVEAGDLIIRLNDTAIRGKPLRETVDLMRGKPGTSIDLTILRRQSVTPLKITVIRDVINVQSVRHEILENNFAYLRISQFQNDTGDEIIRQLRTIKKTVNNKLNGLILDLRNNPGGIFESSVATANAFLDKDKLNYDSLIVYTKGRLAKSEIKEYAKGKDLLNNLPMVVLINGGSASASEIVAGALQDHKRAIILGTKSFGKGSVQTVLPLKDNRGLKLTTALYYTPAGRSIQATGITPDILVENIAIPLINNKEQDLISIKESDLQGHLLRNNEEAENHKNLNNNSDLNVNNKQENNTPLINRDYQLNEALMVLKAMQTLNNK